jgi:tetratricopeptide (TPR) repeat protein
MILRRTIQILLFLVPSILWADTAELIKKGDALDQQLKTQEALSVFLDADKADPHNADILYRIAREYGLSMDDTKDSAQKAELGRKALNAAKQAVAVDADNANAQLALAISYGRKAMLSDNKTKIEYSSLIKEHALRASELDPKNDLAWYVLGSWSYEMANLNGALRILAQVIYGKIPEATNQEAAGYFQKALSLNPSRIGNHVGLGRAYAAMGQKAEAEAELKQALNLPINGKDDIEAKQTAEASLAHL